jgi:GDP-L-fucose synthase
MQSHINVGFSADVTIAELAAAIARVTNYEGRISFDAAKPDGSARKWMDSSGLNRLGWVPLVRLEAGLAMAYENYLLGQ